MRPVSPRPRQKSILLLAIRSFLKLSRLSPIILVAAFVQCIWLLYDQAFTSSVKHKLPKVYPKPTESSPLSPFYSDPYNGPARIFPKWGQAEFPCGDVGHQSSLKSRTPIDRGFLYLKEMKSGSTTLASITARISRNIAQRQLHANSTSACTARFVHTRARRYSERQLDKSFMWSVVREPVARLFSKFYHFEVSRRGVEPTLNNFQKFIGNNEVNDYAYYLKSLSVRKHLNPYRTDMYEAFVQELINGYNFLGVMERFQESLAVLQLLLGLETQDMLYLSAKTQGSFERYNHKCVKIQPTKITQPMKEYVYTSSFEAFVEGDVFVYQAINRSLDMTIEQLGKAKVESTVRRLQWAQRFAEERCSKVVKFPCSDDGSIVEPNDCLAADIACGYQCLDDVGHELASNAEFLQVL
eukprot:scaffold2366_cov115-Cylindrotheca_fusiformis.AAC.2